MSNGPDNAREVASGNRVDAALRQVVAGMRPGWIVLGRATPSAGGQAAEQYALLHAEIGIALLNVLPSSTDRCAADRLRRSLDAAGFQERFGSHPPIAYLCVPSRMLPELEWLLTREFDALPPLALSGAAAWVGAAHEVLAAPRRRDLPRGTTSGGRNLPGRQRGRWGRAEGRLPARLGVGLRGVAVFCSSVALTLGCGALIVQHLGPSSDEVPAARTITASPGDLHADRQISNAVPGTPSTNRLGESPLAPAPVHPGPVADVSAGVGASGLRTGAMDAGGENPPPAASAVSPSMPRPGFPHALAPTDRAGGRGQEPPAVARNTAGGVTAAPERSTQGQDTHSLARSWSQSDVPEAALNQALAARGKSFPFATAVGDASDAVRGPDAEVAAAATASAAGPEAPPAADLGAAAPARASAPAPAGSGVAEASSVAGGQPSLHADPRATATRDGGGVAYAPTPPEAAAEPVAVAGEAAADTASRPSEVAAAREGPTPTPAADARASELPPDPRPPAPRTVAARPDEHAPSGERPSGDMPAVSLPEPSTTPARIGAAAPDAASARGTALGEVSPAPGPDLAATAPQQPTPPAEARGSMEAGVQSFPSVALAPPHPSVDGRTFRPDAVPVARPGATPDNAAPERDADPARPAAGVAAPRPMAPEPDGKAPVEADGTERRLPAAPGSSALAAALVARGDAMVARRDISAARLLYERAAAAGEARAAAALARTYDPAFLAEVGAHGIRGDAALAMAWYRKAAALGDSGARARVEALAGPDGAAPGRP